MQKTKKEFVPKVIDSINSVQSNRLKVLKEKSLFLYDTGKPFTLVKSGNTYELRSSYMNAKAFREGFTAFDLRFVKSVKQYVLNNDIAGKFIDVDYQDKRIHYIEVKRFEVGEVIDDLIEIDIDRAYWDTAYILGIISKGIYNAGLSPKISKVVRLAALGSLARKTETWVFDGKKMNKVASDESKGTFGTNNLWFAICKRVSDVMQDAVMQAGDDFVFYWVDGMYIRNNSYAMAKIMSCFNSWGYESKSRFIKEVTFNPKGFTVQGVLKDDVREFSYPMSDKTTITEFLEDERLKKLAEDIMFKKK